jgi:hypothetical protein
MRFDEYVYDQLIKFPNDGKIFGTQEIYDEEDHFVRSEPYLLINAADISFDSLEELMKEFHGVYIPAHIDKQSNSLLSNLGFIPPNAGFMAAELADLGHLELLAKKNPYLKQCRIITDSDAHMLGVIHEAVNFLECREKNREAVIRALVGR